jgi:molybdate transport system permease protein
MQFVPAWQSAFSLSLQVGLLCALLGAPLAIALGYLLARREFWGRSLLGTLLLAPLVMPPVATGLILLKLFSAHGPLGSTLSRLGLEIPFAFPGAVLASLVVSLPLYVICVRSAFEAIDPRLEEVSATLGFGPARTWWRVTLPLALPGLLAGALLTFARSLGEFGATSVIAGNIEGRTRTISLAIYALLDSPKGEPAADRLLLLSLLLSFGSLLLFNLLNRWQKRRLGESRA